MVGKGAGRVTGGNWITPTSLSAAVLLCSNLPVLPGKVFLVFLFSVALLLLVLRRMRWLALSMLALCWGLFHYQLQLNDRLAPALSGVVYQVDGIVTSTPQSYDGSLRFSFQPDHGQDLPRKVLVTWYRDGPQLQIGQKWQLKIRMKPPWGILNFHGPDRERWLFAQGFGATASVRSGVLLGDSETSAYPMQEIRRHVSQEVSRQLGRTREGGVVRALATADRSALSRTDGHLLRVTGTTHLLAISGLHIGLAAAGGILLSRCLLWFFPLARMGVWAFYFSLAAGVFTATVYAMLANLGVSTVRALLMLLAVTLALCLARTPHPLRSFAVALATVLMISPLAPLSAGFWFSFLAVFSLVFYFQPRFGALSWWKTALQGQAAVFLFLLPAGGAWFSGFSTTGFVANLLAIPWVSFLLVPPVLAGIVGIALPDAVTGTLWHLAGLCTSLLFRFLEWLALLQPELKTLRALPIPLLVGACTGALLLLLPRGLTIRWLGIFFLLPLFLPVVNPVPEGSLLLDVLDVGQGNAIAVNTQRHSILYDTGPGNGMGIDHVGSAIVPYYSNLGRAGPDQVIISHGDLDHSGGLYSIGQSYPSVPVMGSVPPGNRSILKCLRGSSWIRDGFSFLVLHPSRGLPYLRNNSSCVLSVRRAQASILLSGDIEDFVESRLVQDSLQAHSVLIVPHHGSNSSSSPAFINSLRPKLAIASAGLGNRFNFPRPEVRQAYKNRGIPLFTTGECGGLSLLIGPDGEITAQSARNQRPRIWRWPAKKSCP